jgi:hypothetical protein
MEQFKRTIILILAVLVFASALDRCSTRRNSIYREEAFKSRRTAAIAAQNSIDMLRASVSKIRVQYARAAPDVRSVVEMELERIESAIWAAQRELVLLHADSAATRNLIEISFPPSRPMEAAGR